MTEAPTGATESGTAEARERDREVTPREERPGPDAAAERVDRWFARRPALALAALVPIGAVTPLFPVEIGVATFALGTLAVGMAHGAVDHLVPLRAAPDVSLRRSIAVVSLVYAVLGGAVVAAFLAAPVAAFAGFIALTWLHWGQGDVATLAVAGVDHLPTSAERWLALVVRGGLPMGVPLLAHPEEYRLVAEWVVGLFLVDVGAAATAVDPLFAPAVRTGVGVGWPPRRWRRSASAIAAFGTAATPAAGAATSGNSRSCGRGSCSRRPCSRSACTSRCGTGCGTSDGSSSSTPRRQARRPRATPSGR